MKTWVTRENEFEEYETESCFYYRKLIYNNSPLCLDKALPKAPAVQASVSDNWSSLSTGNPPVVVTSIKLI